MRDTEVMSYEDPGTLDDSTVGAAAWCHAGEDAMDLLQFFNNNIVELVLTAQKKNISKSDHCTLFMGLESFSF